MIDYTVIFLLGAVITLYATHKGFRTKVAELTTLVVDLFRPRDEQKKEDAAVNTE